MLHQPTVIILGAGASCDFGLPLGNRLKQEISSIVSARFDCWEQSWIRGDSRSQKFFGYIKSHSICDFDNNSFIESSEILEAGIQGKNSIDDFLSIHQDNKQLSKLAKLAISYLIIESEKNSALYFQKDHQTNIPNWNIENNWYQVLWNCLSQGLRKHDCKHVFDQSKNPLTVITFNYDRSLEHYLFYMLKCTFDISDEEAKQIMQSFNIIHVYGQTGFLPWQNGSTQNNIADYGWIDENIFRKNPGAQKTYLEEISNLIKTYNEEIDNQHISHAIDAIKAAEQIYFIGMAYHQQNMKLLFDNIQLNASTIAGSAIGVEDTRIKACQELLQNKSANALVTLEKIDAYSFIRKYEIPIMEYSF